jgi:IS30 family transposase
MSLSRRNTAKRTRKNVTRHRRAFTDPKVGKLVVSLRKRWSVLDGIERGDRLRALADRGCSTRGLGKKLRQSPTTIRRHLDLAAMPTKDRDAVKAGASAKKILANMADLKRRLRVRKRIAEEGSENWRAER